MNTEKETIEEKIEKSDKAIERLNDPNRIKDRVDNDSELDSLFEKEDD